MSELPYFPLASGLLTGKYERAKDHPADSRLAQKPALGERYATPQNWDKVEKLSAFAERQGHSLLELAFSWLLSHQEVEASSRERPSPNRWRGTPRRATGSLPRTNWPR